MNIFCCTCDCDINATLTNGKEIYPHRSDLHSLPFWKCKACNNFVGCHHKTKNKIRPLGCIPNDEIRNARREIHKILDPIWQQNKFNRTKLYKKISDELGYKYHTAEIKSIDEARKIYKIIKNLNV